MSVWIGMLRKISFLFLTSLLLAQQSLAPGEIQFHSSVYWPPNLTIRAQTDLVEVAAVVRNNKGQVVRGLQKDDFLLTDGGQPREIRTFSVEDHSAAASAPETKDTPKDAATTAAPHVPPSLQRMIALTFDDHSINEIDLRRVKDAAKKFVRESLSPGDRVAVVSIAWPQTVTFSSDPKELEKAIEAIKSNPRTLGETASNCPQLTPYQAYVIANRLDSSLYAAKQQEYTDCRKGVPGDVYDVARRVWEIARSNSEDTLRSLWSLVSSMSKLAGQRVVLLASSGFLTGNMEELEGDLVARALRAGVVVNTLQARGLYTYIPGSQVDEMPKDEKTKTRLQALNAELSIQGREQTAGDDGLAVLAASTGGKFFHDNNDLAGGWKSIGAVPEVVYVLGFSPGDIPHDGRFRPLKVKLTPGHHFDVQARPGYVAPLKDAPPPPAPTELDREVSATDSRTQLPVKIQAGPTVLDGGAAGVRVVVKIDAQLLPFRIEGDRHTQKLILVGALLDEQGGFVAGKRDVIDLALTRETLAKVRASGIDANLTIGAPPGIYRFRAVVTDSMGRITALGRALEIPRR